MSYFSYKKSGGEGLISLDGIRHVECVESPSIGGAPYHDSSRITYADGFVLYVSLECAKAVKDALRSQTAPEKT